jgi:hypothetical protein
MWEIRDKKEGADGVKSEHELEFDTSFKSGWDNN